MSRGWSGGSTTRWRKLRAAVLRANALENGGRCNLGIPGVCTRTAEEVHHVEGKANGDAAAGLMAVCAACNRRVGDPTRRVSPAPRPVTRW
jgi:hypothetical protein